MLLSTRAVAAITAWAMWVLLAACGSGTPAANGPRDRIAADGAEDSEGDRGGADRPDDERGTEPDPSTCAASCTKRIATARQLLARAQAAGNAPNVAVVFRQAGDAFVNAWRGCDLRLPRGEDRGCEHAEAILANMAKAYERAGREDGLIFAYLIALDERWRIDGSREAQQANSALEAAARRAEERASTKPKALGVAEGLAAAVYARLALDDSTGASESAGRFRKLFGAKRREEVCLLATALAAHHGEQGDWKAALRALGPGTSPTGSSSSHAKVLWHSMRGQALAELERHAQARGEFSQVQRLYRPNPKNAATSIGRAKPAPMLGRERVVDAVGAAHFFFGEQLRSKANAIDLPAYRGAATVKDVNRYVQTELARWARKRNGVVLQADETYRKVGRIRPVPPPRWVVAAQSATGALWAEFADAFTSAPMPSHVADDAELRGAWKSATEDASRPLLDKARAAFQACRKAAKHHRIDDERSARCEAWLSEHQAAH